MTRAGHYSHPPPATALKMNMNLRELYLADNKLNGLQDSAQLGNLLKFNCSLQILDLRNNHVLDSGAPPPEPSVPAPCWGSGGAGHECAVSHGYSWWGPDGNDALTGALAGQGQKSGQSLVLLDPA